MSAMAAPTFGQRLRGLRQDRGWTLAALSEACGVSVSFLNDLEHDRTVPSLSRLQSISVAFGTDASGFLAGVDPFGLSARDLEG